MNIAEVLATRAQSHPDVPAIIQGRGRSVRQITFAGLDAAAAQGAGLLRQVGLRPGDSVLVLQPMSIELYMVLSAIFRGGFVAMFLDPSAGSEHVEHCLRLQPPRALIGSAKAHLLRLRSQAIREIPYKFVIGPPVPGATRLGHALRNASQAAIHCCEPETPALLTFTSGSTGEPKAALRTHGFLLAQHQVLAQTLRSSAGDIDLTTMPIVLLANLASGVTSVIPDVDLRNPGAINPAPMAEQILAHRVLSSAASPALFERLARYCRKQTKVLPSLKRLFTGGAPVFPRVLEQMQAMAPNAEVTAVYGSTEAEPIASVAWNQFEPADLVGMYSGRGLLAGRPVDPIRLVILPDRWRYAIGPFTAAQFAADRRNANEPGEIVVSGQHVLRSYHHGQDEELVKFAVDQCVWHRTGDAGYLDDRGRLWLLGRCAARISDDRGTLYPLAVEAACSKESSIRRAAFVSLDGRRVLAIEPADADPCPPDFLNRMPWAQIDELLPCRAIPVDGRHNAKIDYPALARLLKRARHYP